MHSNLARTQQFLMINNAQYDRMSSLLSNIQRYLCSAESGLGLSTWCMKRCYFNESRRYFSMALRKWWSTRCARCTCSHPHPFYVEQPPHSFAFEDSCCCQMLQRCTRVFVSPMSESGFEIEWKTYFGICTWAYVMMHICSLTLTGNITSISPAASWKVHNHPANIVLKLSCKRLKIFSLGNILLNQRRTLRSRVFLNVTGWIHQPRCGM